MSQVKPIRDHRRREAPQEGREWWQWATRALLHRSAGCCERCLKSTPEHRVERHHRMRRRDGGDRLSNLMWLCRGCHQWVTEHPREAIEDGLIIPATWNPKIDPSQHPVVLGIGAARRTVLLDDQGLFSPVNVD